MQQKNAGKIKTGKQPPCVQKILVPAEKHIQRSYIVQESAVGGYSLESGVGTAGTYDTTRGTVANKRTFLVASSDAWQQFSRELAQLLTVQNSVLNLGPVHDLDFQTTSNVTNESERVGGINSGYVLR